MKGDEIMNKRNRVIINTLLVIFFIVVIIIVWFMSSNQASVTETNDLLNDVESNQFTQIPIFEAVKSGDNLLVEDYLNDGVDINIKSSNTLSTLLHIAIAYRQTDTAIFLIDKGIDLEEKDLLGNTPLMLAVYYGDIKVYEKMKERCDIYTVDSMGNTLLHLAASSGNIEIFNELVGLGLDINAENINGNAPLVYANGIDMYKNILGKMNMEEPSEELAQSILFNAISDEVLNEIITREYVDIDMLDKEGNNALVHAYSLGNYEVFKKLIELGININNKNNEGNTVLHLCVRDNMLDYVEVLLQGNADKRAKNNLGLTPVDIANSQENKDMLECLGE